MKQESEEELKKRLRPEQYRVLREKGTEAPFTGKYYNAKEEGVYKCAVCGSELFSSDTKFDSGTGWPSFTDPMNVEHIELRDDTTLGMKRTEVLCKNCGSHLGHVFDDLPETYRSGRAGGPGQNGKRFCINSVCLNFDKKQ